MATACLSPYCKRCGTFGHETEGCDKECKRCGGRHGTRECFRRRSYVAAARGFPPINDNAPNREQAREHSSPKVVASISGLQVLKPRSTPAAEGAQLLGRRWRRRERRYWYCTCARRIQGGHA
ncbi:hypothetical protein HPB50_028954 [Hyalomma asiaticum]|nr:hypothetical protein HPB50_028954 [Hyalomma asiaticum]